MGSTALCHSFQAKLVNVNERLWVHHIEFHQVDHCGTAGDVGGAFLLLVIDSELHQGFQDNCKQTDASAFPPLAHFLYGGDDVWIGTTTAEIAAHAFPDFSVCFAAGFGKQRHRRHDLS